MYKKIFTNLRRMFGTHLHDWKESYSLYEDGICRTVYRCEHCPKIIVRRRRRSQL